MRLAIIRQRYAPYDGAERFLESALEALLERNVAISLYTREWPETKLQLIETVICDPFHVGRLWRDAGFARAVSRVISGAKANLVQSHELLVSCDIYRPGDGLYATWIEEERRGAGVLDRVGLALDPYHRYALATERRLFASPWLRTVICGSKMLKNEIRDRYGLPEDRLPVLYNAVDSAIFHPGLRAARSSTRGRAGIAEDATLFVHVSGDFRRSGAAEAIAALAELPAPAHLVVVGNDPRRPQYSRLARSLGIRDRVTFATLPTDIAAWYGASDAFVLPTVYDPCPGTALEAMACGLPVITSIKSGAAEILHEYDGGLVCPSRDVAGLAAQMRALLDGATRDRLGANARRAALQLTPAAVTLKLVLLYRDLLAATVAPRGDAKSAEGAVGAAPAPELSEAAPTTVLAAMAPTTIVAPVPRVPAAPGQAAFVPAAVVPAADLSAGSPSAADPPAADATAGDASAAGAAATEAAPLAADAPTPPADAPAHAADASPPAADATGPPADVPAPATDVPATDVPASDAVAEPTPPIAGPSSEAKR
ncbi:MAG: glycosyltransferase [Betaproteobacteria bacterium]